MALLDIHLLGSPILRARATEVTEFDDELRRFIDDLFETMDAAEGVGLAANQVGVAKRVAVVGIDDDRFVMVNPVLSALEGRVRGEEGCLSVPDVSGDVTRAERLVLEALDQDGKPYRRELDGYTARAVQHEVDHLDGVMFFDHLSLLKRELLLRRWKKDNPNAGLTRKIVPKTAQQP